MFGTRKSLAVALGAFVIMAVGIACNDDSTSPDQSTMSLLLTDAPGADVAHAYVEITEIYLQGSANQGKVVLLDQSTGMIDLTTLADATLDLVEDVVVPPGVYSQLRVVIGDAVLETDGGKVYTKVGSSHPEGLPSDGFLECPSCSETGIKVNLPDGAVTLEDESKILVLDFDVSQSFGVEGGFSGLWAMNPLINGSDFEASGTIAGNVELAAGLDLPACGGGQPSLSDFIPLASSGDIVKSGSVNDDGSYKISFVEPGEYDLSFEAEVGFDNGESLSFSADHAASASVLSGASVEVDFTIIGASCG